MPATPFDPAKSVIVHSAVPLDTATLGLLQPEDYLLVHSAPCAATNEVLQETNSAGKLVLYVAFNFQLVYTVDADALAISGLANYHPGAALKDHSLAFANGASKPFQFPESAEVGSTGRLIYENPTRNPIAGDMTAVQFQIRQIFNDVGESAYDPGDPDPDDSIPPDYSTGGLGLIWLRKVRILGQGGEVRFEGPYWQTRSLGSGLPLSFEEFRLINDTNPDVPGENEIAEVMRTTDPGGNYLLAPDAGAGEILIQLQGGASTAGDFSGQNPAWNFNIEIYNDDSDVPAFVQEPQTDPPSTTWEQVADAYPPPAGWRIVGIYSLSACAWLDEPEV